MMMQRKCTGSGSLKKNEIQIYHDVDLSFEQQKEKIIIAPDTQISGSNYINDQMITA